MAKQANLNIRTDAEVKAAAGETAAAIQEGRALMQDRNAHGYKNTDDLRSALDV